MTNNDAHWFKVLLGLAALNLVPFWFCVFFAQIRATYKNLRKLLQAVSETPSYAWMRFKFCMLGLSTILIRSNK